MPTSEKQLVFHLVDAWLSDTGIVLFVNAKTRAAIELVHAFSDKRYPCPEQASNELGFHIPARNLHALMVLLDATAADRPKDSEPALSAIRWSLRVEDPATEARMDSLLRIYHARPTSKSPLTLGEWFVRALGINNVHLLTASTTSEARRIIRAHYVDFDVVRLTNFNQE